MDVTAVDLFCGAGGLTHGLEKAGISVSTGIDINPKSKYPYEQNTNSSFRRTDIRPLSQNPERIARLFPWNSDLNVITACAPCQPYSTMGHSKSKNTTDHEKWGLLDDLRKIVEYVEPDVVMTENVLQVRHDEVYKDFVETLEEMGYFVNSDENKNVYCPEYGIPQKRKRWVLLASQKGPIRLPDPFYTDEKEYPAVRETIGHLPPIVAGEVHDAHGLHRSRKLSKKNLERIRNMEPGEDWRIWEECGLDHLLADCHKRDSGRSYKAPYSRMKPDEPAPTITTQFYNYGSGRFGHYDTDQNRALSILEGALLQTFPEDYDFYQNWDDVGVKNLGQLIGNAVPPRLAEVVGESILSHMDAELATSKTPANN
ncbi:DNA cytosine methylase [Halalkalicoccus paucihalophilus]|uniref:DNA (cytosine-5-)-methyltransferase n=1 Tax=Halalkalicoccus paucihalophilus TaxID=1008153 RepID=A0A151AB47_9EURY|nr:DNA cytosine methyltransferase [Halalkalicoccus paucihalophilus]KYH24587.1 DNA cytosine methylase [Halalkalicoccus paucihalophilus]